MTKKKVVSITVEGVLAEAKELGYNIKIPKLRNLVAKRTLRIGEFNEIGVAPHPNCCGAKIIHSLVCNNYYEFEVPFNKRVKNKIPRTIDLLVKLAIVATKGNGSLQYTVAGQDQIADALENNGFYPVQSVKNPKTRRTLTTYFYDHS